MVESNMDLLVNNRHDDFDMQPYVVQDFQKPGGFRDRPLKRKHEWNGENDNVSFTKKMRTISETDFLNSLLANFWCC